MRDYENVKVRKECDIETEKVEVDDWDDSCTEKQTQTDYCQSTGQSRVAEWIYALVRFHLFGCSFYFLQMTSISPLKWQRPRPPSSLSRQLSSRQSPNLVQLLTTRLGATQCLFGVLPSP